MTSNTPTIYLDLNDNDFMISTTVDTIYILLIQFFVYYMQPRSQCECVFVSRPTDLQFMNKFCKLIDFIYKSINLFL